MNKMSRRQFATAALAGSVAPKARAQQKYPGPLAGVEDRAAALKLDSLDFTRDEYGSRAERTMRFSAKSRAQALAWQKQLRSKLITLLGGFPASKTPLVPEVLESRTLPGYKREKVVFQSRPNMTVFAYLLLPENARKPMPAMICLPGHGRGADPVAGIDEHGEVDTADKEYQHRFGVQAAEHGYAALVVEMLGFGCRRDPAARKRSLSASSCQPAAGAALLMGQTMAGWRTWDVMRSIDYLATRPEIDSKRVGCMGISGGGTVTLYAAALEPRIKAAVLSCSFASYRDSIFSIQHCIDNYVPGILSWAEMSDVAGLIAPRAVFVEAGERDNIFPVASARESFEHLRRIYSVLGTEDRAGIEVFPSDHSFWGKGAFEFLGRHL